MKEWQFLSPMTEKPTIIDAWGIQEELKNDFNINYKEVGVYDKKRYL